jgi:transglutaminase-like putative cysteine protease
MFKNTQDFTESHDGDTLTGEARFRWLRGTRQLDVMTPLLNSRAVAVTQVATDDREKAVFLHDYIKALPFACVPNFAALTASEVLKLGQGDCFTKGMLFVAMLRALLIPARLRFVMLPTDFLHGIIEPEDLTIVHAMAEIYLQGRWRVTDSYVPDAWLQAGARSKLRAEGRKIGYGVHLQGHDTWNGLRDASAQCTTADPSTLPVVDMGVADDPESFYADHNHGGLRRNFATRLKWRLAAPIVNKRVAAVRAIVQQPI